MAELDRFEARFAAAYRRYLDEVPTEVDAAAVARAAVSKRSRRRGSGAPLGLRWVVVPKAAWLLLLLAGLLAALVGGMLGVGSQRPTWGPRADLQTPVATIDWPTWSPASAGDIALVDRLNEFFRAHDITDVATLEAVWAGDLVFTVEGEVYGGRDGVRESLSSVSGTFAVVGDVAVTTDPVPGLWSLPAGSRFVAFVESTTGELRDIVLEVDAEDRIAVFYNDVHLPPAERASDGYTPVDFGTIPGRGASAGAPNAQQKARLTLVEVDGAGSGDLSDCQDPGGGASLVFLHLRLEDMQPELLDIESDTVEVRAPGGERLGTASCQRAPVFEPASSVRDGWMGVMVPANVIGRLSLVYRHVDPTQGDQQPAAPEVLIPFDLPPT